MASYMKARWFHGKPENPTWLYAELDEDRNELRKVDVFADGHLQAASDDFWMGTTNLGLEPTPPLDEINSQDEFDAVEILRAEFEEVWLKAMAQIHASR